MRFQSDVSSPFKKQKKKRERERENNNSADFPSTKQKIKKTNKAHPWRRYSQIPMRLTLLQFLDWVRRRKVNMEMVNKVFGQGFEFRDNSRLACRVHCQYQWLPYPHSKQNATRNMIRIDVSKPMRVFEPFALHPAAFEHARIFICWG